MDSRLHVAGPRDIAERADAGLWPPGAQPPRHPRAPGWGPRRGATAPPLPCSQGVRVDRNPLPTSGPYAPGSVLTAAPLPAALSAAVAPGPQPRPCRTGLSDPLLGLPISNFPLCPCTQAPPHPSARVTALACGTGPLAWLICSASAPTSGLESFSARSPGSRPLVTLRQGLGPLIRAGAGGGRGVCHYLASKLGNATPPAGGGGAKTQEPEVPVEEPSAEVASISPSAGTFN